MVDETETNEDMNDRRSSDDTRSAWKPIMNASTPLSDLIPLAEQLTRDGMSALPKELAAKGLDERQIALALKLAEPMMKYHNLKNCLTAWIDCQGQVVKH